jgi:uncharacterized protein YjbI with pentapeptide repeats
MANDEHVAMLGCGAAAWNAWRAEHGASPDLSQAGLRGPDLSGFDLSRADLRGADLRGTRLCDADLSGGVAWNATIPGGGSFDYRSR